MPYKDPNDPRKFESRRKSVIRNRPSIRAANIQIKAEQQAWIRDQKSLPCMDCGVKYPYYVMDFDHRDPAEKLYQVARLAGRGWPLLRAEVAKCDVVCANCHRERTHGHRVDVGGLEPPTACVSDKCSNQAELNVFGLW